MRASTLLYEKYKIFGDGSQSTSEKGALIDHGDEGQNGPHSIVPATLVPLTLQ